jgi:hypothetical protein
MLINFAGECGNGNTFFNGKWHVQKWKWTSIATVPDLCQTTVNILIHLISHYQLPLTSRWLEKQAGWENFNLLIKIFRYFELLPYIGFLFFHLWRFCLINVKKKIWSCISRNNLREKNKIFVFSAEESSRCLRKRIHRRVSYVIK